MQVKGNKIAFLFPGQGVQAQGVIEYHNFLKNKSPARLEEFIQLLQESLDEINPKSKFEVLEILDDELSPSWAKTSFVQPLTFILSILTHELVKDKDSANYVPIYMLGHSFGAFSALTASGSMPLKLGARIVAARGKFMQEESEKANKGMLAILGLTEDKVREICKKTGCVIALINAPTAAVVGALRKDFSKIEEEAARLKATKTIRLNTSGAFHTQAMEGAYQKFKEFIKPYTFKEPEVPLVTNIEGKASNSPAVLKNDVAESMKKHINWMRMMNFLKAQEVAYYIECGPGNSLSSLCRLNGIEREKIIHARELIGKIDTNISLC